MFLSLRWGHYKKHLLMFIQQISSISMTLPITELRNGLSQFSVWGILFSRQSDS